MYTMKGSKSIQLLCSLNLFMNVILLTFCLFLINEKCKVMTSSPHLHSHLFLINPFAYYFHANNVFHFVYRCAYRLLQRCTLKTFTIKAFQDYDGFFKVHLSIVSDFLIFFSIYMIHKKENSSSVHHYKKVQKQKMLVVLLEEFRQMFFRLLNF